MSDLGSDKLPGLDGFSLAFYKFCWPIVGCIFVKIRSIEGWG